MENVLQDEWADLSPKDWNKVIGSFREIFVRKLFEIAWLNPISINKFYMDSIFYTLFKVVMLFSIDTALWEKNMK